MLHSLKIHCLNLVVLYWEGDYVCLIFGAWGYGALNCRYCCFRLHRRASQKWATLTVSLHHSTNKYLQYHQSVDEHLLEINVTTTNGLEQSTDFLIRFNYIKLQKYEIFTKLLMYFTIVLVLEQVLDFPNHTILKKINLETF